MIADLFQRQYAPPYYHCAHFAAEVYRELTGQDVSEQVGLFHDRADVPGRRHFRRVDVPTQTCIAVMHSRAGQSHVGVWHQGRIIHLSGAGPANMPVASVMVDYPRVRYYACA